jgi:erythromycin esterase-like protein
MGENMSNENIEVSKIMTRLQDVQKNQLKNSQAMYELDCSEQDFLEFNRQDIRMLNSLYNTWKADNEMNHMINDNRIKLQHCKRKIINEMEQKREKLIADKKRLYKQEEDLYTLKRAIIQEGKV